MRHELQFYTEYRQFYICDKNSPCETNSDNFWTEEASNDRLAMETGIVGVGTECYGPVSAELHILDYANIELDYGKYDHIVEGGLELKSGILQVLDCPISNTELEITLLPGLYRIRVNSSGLNTVVGDSGNDYYKIEIWPDNNIVRKVLKRYVRI